MYVLNTGCPFVVCPSTATLLHRKPAPAGILRNTCRTHYLQLIWEGYEFEFCNNRNISIYLLSLASSSVVIPLLWDVNCKVHPITGHQGPEGE